VLGRGVAHSTVVRAKFLEKHERNSLLGGRKSR
jgi:hypothetical protein